MRALRDGLCVVWFLLRFSLRHHGLRGLLRAVRWSWVMRSNIFTADEENDR